MKKILLFSIIFISLLLFANLASANGVTFPNPLKADTFIELTDDIIFALDAFIVSVAVVMLIIAGILFLTSAGSPERLQTAKNFLKYAIIGIVIGVTAETIKEVILWILGRE